MTDTPRYLITCDGCGWSDERERDTKVVKEVRIRERECPDCGYRLRLEKDDRPDPPICPQCGDEAIEVKYEDDDDRASRYLHGVEVIEMGGIITTEKIACFV